MPARGLAGAITPIFVVAVIRLYGWRAPFWMLALLGLFWVGGLAVVLPRQPGRA